MKNKNYKIVSLLLCLCLLLSVVGCGKEESSAKKEETDISLETLALADSYVSQGASQGMEVVAQNSKYQLLLDPATATIAVYVKDTGYLWRSNLDESSGALGIDNEDVRDEYMSQLILSYYDASNKEIFFNSYRHGVVEENVAFYGWKDGGKQNGIRIVYQIGKNIDDVLVPAVIPAKWMDELTKDMSPLDAYKFRSYWYVELRYDEIVTNDTQMKTVKNEYKNFKEGDVFYKLDTNSKTQKQEIYADYLLGRIDNFEKLEAIYADAGFNFRRPDDPRFTIAVDYKLSEQGLSVNVPVGDIKYKDGSFRLHKLKLLPYFGSVADGSEGQMLIPDGSGALVDVQYETNASIALPFYGADNSLRTVETAQNMQQATLPVYGLTNGENAFVAHVSQGEAVGSLECHPKNKVYPYANMGTTYIVHPFETFASNGATTNVAMQKYAEEPFKGNIAIDYMFATDTTGEGVDYVDLAKMIRGKLFSGRETIKADKLGFTFDTYGTVMRKTNFLGYAYNKDIALTTIAQAQAMYDTLTAGGVSNISVRYNNLFSDKYINKLSNIGDVEKVVGKDKEFTQFMNNVAGKGGVVYPNIEILFEEYSTSLSNATWHSKFIEGTLIDFSASNLYSEGVTADFRQIIVKSGELVERIGDLLADAKDLGGNALSFTSIGKYLFSDFAETTLNYRDTVQADMEKVLAEAKKQGNKIMVDMGNAYTLPYVDSIIDAPMSCSNLSFEVREVPFLQIVLHGYVSFSGTPLNLSDNYEMMYLKSVEYGADLAFTLNHATAEMIKNTNYSELYSTNFDHWKDRAIQAYNDAAAVLNGCQGATIEDHVMLEDEVFMTTYSNGVNVVVNYSDTDYTHTDGTTVASMSYARVAA